MTTCTECNEPLPDGARFCIACAAPVLKAYAAEAGAQAFGASATPFAATGETTRLQREPIGYYCGEPVYADGLTPEQHEAMLRLAAANPYLRYWRPA